MIIASTGADEIRLQADFSVPRGKLRALHGINKGPLAPGGLIDLTADQKALGIPFTRLHDCGWPNPYVVDHHAVFPNPDADPARAESYDFRLTDEYIAAVRATGAEPIYRLGESIEHTSVKRFAHPPADMAKWTEVCLGIIRHYNEGWANGFRHNIRYWEIWNEPENRPVMWSGTDEDYLRLYATAATAIKKEFPSLKVGGPALGASGHFVNGEFRPTDFAVKFLDLCRQENVPLNFFSWHCYTDDPTELTSRARAIRRFLDSKGFTDTESHLNEWNYLPAKNWDPIGKTAAPDVRQRTYARMSGPDGAAFVMTSLLELQDAPVNVCNLFHGELGAFGIFSDQGVPLKLYESLRAFQDLMATPHRVETRGHVSGKLAFAAGLDAEGREATMLASNFADSRTDAVLRWQGFSWTGGVVAEVRVVDLLNSYSQVRTVRINSDSPSLRISLPAPSVAVVRLRPADGTNARVKLSVTAPASRLVYQRDSTGHAHVPVAGQGAWPGAVVEARTVEINSNKTSQWQPIGKVAADFAYRGQIKIPAGWYRLEVRAKGDRHSASAAVERFGVGEVFVVVGHSVAHGGDINLPGAQDDRVNTIALGSASDAERQYNHTGNPSFLPPPMGAHFDTNVQPAPAGRGTYFWSAFAEHVARAQNVPVLILNAAFGGTSLEHWAKSARGEPFPHGFVNASIRMPYIRLEHALTRYCAVTGLRAILADQGQNDWPEKDEEKIFANYKAWIDQARKDAHFPNLAIVVNRQSPPGSVGQIRRVQNRVFQEYPNCYPGPDYDTFEPQDTTDKVHLSEAGARKAAKFWSDALDANFFKTAAPMLPKPPSSSK
jgi:hypothetical protein